MALRGKRENGRGCTVYLHKCKLETKRIVVGFAVCHSCSCFSEEGARLLTTSFFSLFALLIKALHKPLNYRANVFLGSTLGKRCLCGCWFPKIDVDSHCLYSVKTATAAVGEFQHGDFCRDCTLHTTQKYVSSESCQTKSSNLGYTCCCLAGKTSASNVTLSLGSSHFFLSYRELKSPI